MRYDLSDPFQRQQAQTRFAVLQERGSTIELSEKRVRTLQQNAYLHVCIAYLAQQLGEQADYVKRAYFKTECNADLFLRRRRDERLGREISYLRSSSELTKEEMSIATDRFRDWASQACGVYIPSAEEKEFVSRMQTEVERGRRWT